MKKLICAGLALLFLLGAFGCGSSDPNEIPDGSWRYNEKTIFQLGGKPRNLDYYGYFSRLPNKLADEHMGFYYYYMEPHYEYMLHLDEIPEQYRAWRELFRSWQDEIGTDEDYPVRFAEKFKDYMQLDADWLISESGAYYCISKELKWNLIDGVKLYSGWRQIKGIAVGYIGLTSQDDFRIFS